jgi:hypothetical protein
MGYDNMSHSELFDRVVAPLSFDEDDNLSVTSRYVKDLSLMLTKNRNKHLSLKTSKNCPVYFVAQWKHSCLAAHDIF